MLRSVKRSSEMGDILCADPIPESRVRNADLPLPVGIAYRGVDRS